MYHYKPRGVCCDATDVDLDGGVIRSVRFHGGCDGNLNAISKLAAGMDAERVAALLEGNTCHRHDNTSCADQMAKALRAASAASAGSPATGGAVDISRRQFAYSATVGLASATAFGLPSHAFAGTGMRRLTDSLGRMVDLPSEIDFITPLGDVAQCLVCTLCPDALASVASEVDEEDAEEYCEAGFGEVADLPETGGGASSGVEGIDAQLAANTGARLMLDVGLPKVGLSGELDALQEETGIPCFFIDCSFGNLPVAYRTLGGLLGRQERAEELASYVEEAMARAASVKAGGEACTVFYAPRSLGLEVKSSVDVQTDAVSFVGATPLMWPYDFSNRTVDVSALEGEDIDFVIFDDTSCLGPLAAMQGSAWDIWGDVSTIAEGRFLVSPALLYSWFGSLVHVQSIGVLWLASVLWPTSCTYDIAEEADAFYRLFYGLEKGSGEMDGLVGSYGERGYAHE